MRFKNYFYFIALIWLISSCSASKQAENNIKSGNYDEAFEIGFEKLSKDKNDDKLVLAFKRAFDKANERDLKQIDLYKTQNNPINLKKIYALYEALDARQYQVISLQPLYHNGKEVAFNITDYSNEIAASKRNYSQYLLSAANEKMKGTKLDAREAYKMYGELEYVNPTYVSNITDLINQAKARGSSFVWLKLDNKIASATTQEDVNELLRIEESNMKNPWVIYHNTKDKKITYDYEVSILLSHLNIAPQQVNSELIPQQARIIDGWEYIYDSNGNVAKDSLGNDRKRDKIITVQAEVRVMQQIKSGQVDGTITIKNLINNTTTANTPVLGEARFENTYAIFRGDQRAIEEKYYQLLQNKEVPFPIDSEFIKYALADFKAKMLQIIDNQQFN
jgi:hypothetical protein